jgi:shikimate dehydrogenase
LWNAAFNEYGLNSSMVPLDVTRDNILNLLDDLNQDANFIGGAIAVPYKEVVAKWLGKNTTSEAKNIGAVNCLYRNDNGELEGTNTDGEAALRSYESKYGSVKGKTVAVLGTGGAAKAVAAYFSTGVESDGEVMIVGRSKHGRDFADNIKINWIDWSELNDRLTTIDLIINCTTVGFEEQEKLSPLTGEQIQQLKKSAVVFDIIYQPIDTVLRKITRNSGRSEMGGLAMNLEQAVLAFNYTNSEENNEVTTRKIMQSVNH